MTSGIENKIPTSGPFTTRLATTDDAAILVQIGIKTFQDTFAEFNTEEDMKLYLEKTFTLQQVEHEIKNPTITFILAEHNNQIVGYAKLRADHNPPELSEESAIEIERIYCIKQFIGRNVGKILIEACLDRAKQRRYHVIWLGVWEHNTRAIAFYEKWGFKKFGSHPFLLGTDLQTDLLMKRNA
jgi:ribosomal protein S18 acetylase RimI-like enzyme